MAVEGIYTEKEKCENVYFNLKDGKRTVALELVDEKGEPILCGNILFIDKKTGKIITCSNVNHELGFTLDSCGRVIVY